MNTHANVDPRETAKFAAMAARWWDPEGEFRPLHALNPVRLEYVRERLGGLAGKRILDVGCGGGLLSEALAAEGAEVVGIDATPEVLEVARLHLKESGLTVDYRLATAEELATAEPGAFDAVTCMEMLEHVPDPGAVIDALARLVRPGGRVFLSTINRTPQAFLGAIVGAEYLLRWLPRGTHEYAKLIRPAELERWLRHAGLHLEDLSGVRYHPLSGRFSLGGPLDINYLACALRPEA